MAPLAILPCVSLHTAQDLSEKLSFLTVESNAYLETPAMDALAENGFDISRETRQLMPVCMRLSTLQFTVWTCILYS